MTWNHRLRLVSIASAALMLTASAAGAQTVFGFNIMEIERPTETMLNGNVSSRSSFRAGRGIARCRAHAICGGLRARKR